MVDADSPFLLEEEEKIKQLCKSYYLVVGLLQHQKRRKTT
jgi:hypothetical protein